MGRVGVRSHSCLRGLAAGLQRARPGAAGRTVSAQEALSRRPAVSALTLGSEAARWTVFKGWLRSKEWGYRHRKVSFLGSRRRDHIPNG